MQDDSSNGRTISDPIVGSIMIFENSSTAGIRAGGSQTHVGQLPPSARFAIGGQLAFGGIVVGPEGGCYATTSVAGMQISTGDNGCQSMDNLNRTNRGRSRISGACVTCAAAKKACDEVRPCTRYVFLISATQIKGFPRVLPCIILRIIGTVWYALSRGHTPTLQVRSALPQLPAKRVAHHRRSPSGGWGQGGREHLGAEGLEDKGARFLVHPPTSLQT